MGSLKNFKILTKHFFNRLFQNDVIAFGDQMRQRVFSIMAVLASILGLISFMLLGKYEFIQDNGTSWEEKCYIIAFFMVMMGIIAVLEWDAFFPDDRDYLNISPLPVREGTIFNAKIASLFLFAGLFALGMNLFTTFVFWLYLPQWLSTSLLFSLYFVFVHVLTTFAALLFSLFFFNSLAGLIMAVGRSRFFDRISTFFRSIFLALFVLLSFGFFRGAFYGTNWFMVLVTQMKNSNSIWLYFFPPMWFTGMYETLLGNQDPQYQALFYIAVSALLFLIAVFYVLARVGYKKNLKERDVIRRKRPFLVKLKSSLSKSFNAVFLRDLTQRAIFYFYWKTIKASMFHKIRLISYLASGVGLILILFVSHEAGVGIFFTINKTMLSTPIILSLFMIIGVRGNVNLPVSLEANWIFQQTERKEHKHYFLGIKKGVVLLHLLPLFLILMVFYLGLWEKNTAVIHVLFGFSISILLMEVFFLKYNKIPFACSYLPGKEKLQFYWILYVFVYVVVLSILNSMEAALLKNPSGFPVFLAGVFLIILSIRVYQAKVFYKKNGIKYEEEPEVVMIDLDYKLPLYKRGSK
jgi:hypothetical protein